MTVTDSTVDLPTPSGPMRTYLYTPYEPGRPARRLPGVLLYSEIFQQTAPVRRLAVQVASLGYRVAVPEVYHAHEPAGCVLGYDDAGKARRICLARTLLSQADVIVFDEPTSGLDFETEATFLAELPALTHGRTAIVITHAAVPPSFDRVLELRAGQLRERRA